MSSFGPPRGSASSSGMLGSASLIGARVVDDGDAPRVDEGDMLLLHVELLHPRERQKLNTSMIPRILASQEQRMHDQSGMYSTKD